MNNTLKRFREKLQDGKYVYGIFTKANDPMITEIQGIANYDFTILDCEHGPSSISDQQNNIRAALVRNMVPIIRVNELTENTIGKALDMGALGVQAPQITSAEEARKVVEYARFYPYGERGVCRFVRAAGYSSMDRNDYFAESKDLLVILQLEGLEAIKNLNEILEVEGVDILFIGPYDLSQAMEVPGDIKNPRVLEAMVNIVEKAKQKNIVVGTFTDDFEMVAKWKKLGVQYISYSTDAGMFYDYSRDIYNTLNMIGEKEDKAYVLDCTLRDGGYINSWNFGRNNIKKTIVALEESNVDFIECGFLRDKEYVTGSTQFNSIEMVNKMIGKKSDKNYCLMINYGAYDLENLPEYSGYGINCIRVAFHKKDLLSSLKYCEEIGKKGYKVFLQPMVTAEYTDNEFEYMINECNRFKPFAVYVADSFGNMNRSTVLHYYKMLERLLDNDIYPGFHSHNNMQLSFSNVITLLDNANRKFIIDSSIYGMGRGAGNLNTELLVEYLNDNYGGNYSIVPVLETMDVVLNKIYNKNPWGYSLPNYLSAKYNAHPYYAKHLIEKNNLTLKDMNSIFAMLDQNKKLEFDANYVEDIYETYLDMPANDVDYEKVKGELKDKDIVVLAPGKSLVKNAQIIKDAKDNGSILISINFAYTDVDVDYIFVGNIRRMEEIDSEYRGKVIATSNVPGSDCYAKIAYSKLLNDQEYVKDNSGLMLLKLLCGIGCKSIKVFGMDGYTYDTAENYSSNELEISSSNDNIDNMNFGMKIQKNMYCEMGVEFVR